MIFRADRRQQLPKTKYDFSKSRLLVMDVDGTLTDGKIYIGEQTLKNYEKGDEIFPMYINTELYSVDSLDRIIFDHKGKTIETEVIGKFTSKPEAKEKEIINFLNSYINDEKESLEEEAKNEALKYDDYEIEEINKKIKMRYISLLEPQTTMISNPERKALVLRVLKENLK